MVPLSVMAICLALPTLSATFNAPNPAGNFKPALSASGKMALLAIFVESPEWANNWEIERPRANRHKEMLFLMFVVLWVCFTACAMKLQIKTELFGDCLGRIPILHGVYQICIFLFGSNGNTQTVFTKLHRTAISNYYALGQ